jgi:hypothetical protein
MNHLYNDMWWIAIFSLCWSLILLHYVLNEFLSVSSHVSPISSGFQMILSFQIGQAWPCICPPPRPVPGSFGSRQLPIFLSDTFPVQVILSQLFSFYFRQFVISDMSRVTFPERTIPAILSRMSFLSWLSWHEHMSMTDLSQARKVQSCSAYI